MSRAIEPIRAIGPIPRRRRRDDAVRAEAGQDDEFVDVRIRVAAKKPAESPRGRGEASPTIEAHLIAQSAQMRGLKGGAERLETARHTYLGTEFSGPNDRRPRKGLITKREV